jgi:Carbohydrate esterase, sialic acid-specific acetylesterase
MKTLPLLFVSLCLLGPLAHAAVPAKKLKVFICAGQSNMDGRADFDKISDADKQRLAVVQPRVKLAYNMQPVVPLTGAKGTEGLKKKYGADHSFGPEIFFGICLAEANPGDQFLLIKRSVGATSLYGRWNPDWDSAKAKVMGEEKAAPLYPDLIAYVREILSAYPKDSYEICGMLWVQGEADGNVSGYGPEPAKAYGQNIKNLITRVRTDLGVPDLPFMMFQVVMGGDVVRGMQEAAATVKNVTAIPRSMDQASPNFLEQYAVGHYNQVGMKRMGELFAEAWFSKYAKPSNQTHAMIPRRVDEVGTGLGYLRGAPTYKADPAIGVAPVRAG